MHKPILFLVALTLLGTAHASLPNVIYILADDLGIGDLSCYGQEKLNTPNIDRLATEGIQFSNHYSGNTVCTPSRAVLMTGMHPGKCYVRGNMGKGAGEAAAAIPDKFTNLAEVFKAAGYTTGAYGKWGLGITNADDLQNPCNQGFDHYSGWESQVIAHTYYPGSVVRDGQKLPIKAGTYVHDLIMDDAFQFIRTNAEAGTPFFCYIPTAIPHAAMHAPKDLHEKWRKVFPEHDDKIGKYGAGSEPCPDVQNPIAGFAGMMEHLDNNVGTILKILKETGADDNTLIIFSSDNGTHREGGHDPAFWNSSGNLRGMKRNMHEGGIRTPMLARWPNTIKAGSKTDHISAFWDVVPTICDIIGQAEPEQSDGISFLPTLAGKKRKQKDHDYLYFEFCGNDQIISQALRKGKWKAFIGYPNSVKSGPKPKRKASYEMELYDLDKDPYEEINLAADFPEMVDKMQTLMKEAHTPIINPNIN